MTMNKMFAGLIAFVAGVALSAGSAFATNGYVGGDHARMKLVPYYETGANKATIIGIQNLSPQETTTADLNADVTDIQAFLNGQAATANAAPLINTAGGLEGTAALATDGTAMLGDPPNLNQQRAAQAALEAAMEAAYIEHSFVTVNVHDHMGMMMGSATLCLAENQFGYVILQGPEMQDGQMEMPNRGMILSVMDGDIPEYGYAMISAGTRKYDGCTAVTPDGLTRVDNDAAAAGFGNTMNMIAAWAIIQDTGMGFFGTEVPTATVSMAQNAGPDLAVTTDDGDPELACYTNSDDAGTSNAAVINQTPNTSGPFVMGRCGLIPERHDIRLTGTAPNRTVNLASTEMTINAIATARYDIGDESMVYLWLAKGMDTDATLPRDMRMVMVSVTCEDGMMPMGPDTNGDNMPDPVMVAAPGMVTMIDPTMGAVGGLTDMCDGDRGVLNITMPDNSHAGMVFTHITQMMGHYRMNFPGYSMAADGLVAPGGAANPMERCTDTSTMTCR